MKVLLVNPNRYHYAGAKGPRSTLPLGLMYIASYLEKYSVQVKLLDCLTSPSSSIRKEGAIVIHGMTDDDFKRIISDETPDIVGIGFPFSAQLEGALKSAKLVNEVDPKIIVIAGGPHVSVNGVELLKQNQEISYGVRGEGEAPMLRIVQSLDSGIPVDNIPGLIYRSDGEVKSNQPELFKDLDSLPYPAYHLLDMDRFFYWVKKISGRAIKGHNRSISMITSRGCPFNCVFCSIHLHMGKKFRYHSSEYVLKHIEYVIKEFSVSHIAFEDDNLTLKPERCTEIFSEIVDRALRINWNTPNGIRADFLDENLLRLMKKSGCLSLTIAPESGSQKTLDTIVNKKLDLNKVPPIAKLCHELGIPLNSYFVIGLPGETKTAMQETIDFAKMLYDKYNVMPSIFSATPLIGTKLHEIVMSNGYLAKDMTPKNLMSATQAARGEPMIRTPDFTPEDVKEFSRQMDQHRAKTEMLKKKINKSAPVLHIVPYSFPQPEHKFLGSTKDIYGRIDYFKNRGLDFDLLAPNARDDRSLLTDLSKIDLSKYHTVLIEKSDYPLSMLHIKEKAPHVKILLRGHNAEFYHHIHRIIARLKDNWHDNMSMYFAENMWDMETSIKWGSRDFICSQLADAVLSITDWERLNYWNLFTDPKKVYNVPSFLSDLFIPENLENKKRDLCVCYMSNGINPMLLDSCKQFNSLVESLTNTHASWDFAITGDPEKIGLNLSDRITKLGLLNDPFSILKEARCIVILSDLGFGFKTKILDAVLHKCWTIVPNGLYNYLPEAIRPFCIRLNECSKDEFKKALQKSTETFPEGDPNSQFRDIAFQALDEVFGLNKIGEICSNTLKIDLNQKSGIINNFYKTLKSLDREHDTLNMFILKSKILNMSNKSTDQKIVNKCPVIPKPCKKENVINLHYFLALRWVPMTKEQRKFLSVMKQKVKNKLSRTRIT